MIQLGQEVYVEATAYPDVTIPVWEHIKVHNVGTVEHIGEGKHEERLVAVSFPNLSVGHSCNGKITGRHGQYITEVHLRPLVYNNTVPNLPALPEQVNDVP